MTKTMPFRLRALILPVLPLWVTAWLLGLLTVVSVIGLLMVSGWFVTMSALAGLIASGAHGFNYLAPSAWIRSFAIGRTLGRYGELMVSHYAVFELLKRLRLRFFYEFVALPMHARAELGSALAQHRLVKDIDALDEFVLKFVSPWLLGMVALVVFGVIAFFMVGLPALLLLMVPVLAWLGLWHSQKMATQESALIEQRKLRLLTELPALTQLLIWGRWQARIAQVMATDKKLSALMDKQGQVRRLTQLFVQWLLMFTLLALLWVGLGHLGEGWLNVAWLLALVLGVFGLAEVLMPMVSEQMAWGRAKVAKDKLNALLSTPSAVVDAPVPEAFDLLIDRLSVRQPKAVFGVQDFSWHVKSGVPLIISGASGAGKSTLLDALAGALTPVAGALMALTTDGRSLDWHKIDWQGQLGFLGQRIDIFDQSLRDNLKLGKPSATDEELYAVLALVGLEVWARAQPLGLNTPLGEYGMAISGGQARRIALARLLLTQKKVLLLDEPFAGLDDASRLALWEVLITRQKNAILIVVSHHDFKVDGRFEQAFIHAPSGVVA